ncbi:hypothetical protein [Paratractidigestivibacter sp.]|uniref:hypothetical protein n=1 Tax=Paratractidigestivibacter sp. TaxID=2847316 RepID=UPI002ABDEE09|nr:hypothetical protein [Paratractidigestivibacter sp.]
MSIQEILRIVGIALLVAAAALAAAAAYTYRTLDIRGVKDDLAGKRRDNRAVGERKARPGRRADKNCHPAAAPAARAFEPPKPPRADHALWDDAPRPLQADRSLLDDATDVLGGPGPAPAKADTGIWETRSPASRDPLSPERGPAPAIQFRVTRKEIVVPSEKIIEE